MRLQTMFTKEKIYFHYMCFNFKFYISVLHLLQFIYGALFLSNLLMHSMDAFPCSTNSASLIMNTLSFMVGWLSEFGLCFGLVLSCVGLEFSSWKLFIGVSCINIDFLIVYRQINSQPVVCNGCCSLTR